MSSSSLIVTGGQYGSEGKGAFIHHIARDYDLHVRVGGPQAGHSAKLETGEVFKARVVPVGVLSGKIGLIAMASVVDIDQLSAEIQWLRDRGVAPQVYVDGRATVLAQHDIDEEEMTELTTRIGSTGKGVGAARSSRIMRSAGTATDYEDEIRTAGATLVDSSAYLRDTLRHGGRILVEAAQGQHLSLFSGGYYPFCTSAECGPTQAFADLGLSLRHARYFESMAVFRTHPIRVAGNSGPLYEETSWEGLRHSYGDHIPVERTTVTDKVRRVGDWDSVAARISAVQTGINWAVLSFLDYPYPDVTGMTDWDEIPYDAQLYVQQREKEIGVPIRYAGTSFGTYTEVPA